ncbi:MULTISPECIES: hypothetical protein [unclassified Streptomyces]|uniref:hypothetical protein n=1 Tax=unclassified Streptomyces TaxID=2593676 RepID=UPI001F0F96F7|nr:MULTISPECIES: hypothetical protein [unclassified Streptomyces]
MPGGGPRTTVREVGADGHELRLTVNYQGRRREDAGRAVGDRAPGCDGTRPARAHPAAYDPQVRERLAVVTEQLLGM